MSLSPESDTKYVFFADPGIDDSLGLLASVALPGEEGYPAYVATHGNSTIPETFGNLRRIAEFITLYHRESDRIPPYVVAGDGDLTLEEKYGSNLYFIHGSGAMEGAGLYPRSIREGDRAELLYQHLIREGRSDIGIISFGALTEVHTILNHQELLHRIKSITIMGGAFKEPGNVEPNLEANLRHNPVALQQIIRIANENNIEVTLVPLDVTHNKLLELTDTRMRTLTTKLKTSGSAMIAEFLERLAGRGSTYYRHYVENTKDRRDQTPPYDQRSFYGPEIHDLTTLMVMLFPKLFLIVKNAQVKVTLTGSQAGSINFAQNHMNPDGKVNVVMDLASKTAAELYWNYYLDILANHYK